MRFFFAIAITLTLLLPAHTHGEMVNADLLEGLDTSAIADTSTLPTLETNFYLGTVLEVQNNPDVVIDNQAQPDQLIKVRLERKENKEVVFEHGGRITIRQDQKVKVGDQVIVGVTTGDGTESYAIQDRYRLPWLISFVGLFVLCAGLIGGWKGLFSFSGLAANVAVLFAIILPMLANGYNPLLVAALGGTLIAATSLYLAHGFRRQTTISLIATLSVMLLAIGISSAAVYLAQLSGVGSEDAYDLSFSLIPGIAHIDVRGLLLAGILIGALGVLDDITTGQVAVVAELHAANANLSNKELFSRAIRVGREHIASLVNTLVLAYAGASLPGLLILMYSSNAPWWMIINSEFLAEEIVRSLAGSIVLILAVPIATAMAVWWGKKK